MGPVLPSVLHDADGEAVRKKAQEEQREEQEKQAMGNEDQGRRPLQATGDTTQKQAAVEGKDDGVHIPGSSGNPSVFGDEDGIDMSCLKEMEDELAEDDLYVPRTPLDERLLQQPSSPRPSPTRHAHGDDVEDESHEAKKARVEDQKRQRIGMLRELQDKMIRTVKFGGDEYHTLDDYSNEPQLESTLDDEYVDDVWGDEETLQFSNVPSALWSDSPIDVMPPQPEPWIDKLADEVEIQRLLGMGVLQERSKFEGEISGVLTTRFVYDWRLKTFDNGSSLQQGETKRWMRWSRYVAREFSNDKRDDVYSPATGCHTANLIPILFLQRLKQLELSELGGEEYDEILASLDIKDGFLEVPQEHVVSATLHGTEYVVLRNLPGQRLGAKAWYWFFRNFVTDSMQFEWCDVQPCLAKW